VYSAAMTSGHAEHDTAAVYEVLERMAPARDGRASGESPDLR
jgi:hypothetical protein